MAGAPCGTRLAMAISASAGEEPRPLANGDVATHRSRSTSIMKEFSAPHTPQGMSMSTRPVPRQQQSGSMASPTRQQAQGMLRGLWPVP